MYAKIVNQVIEKYPYTRNDLKRDNPNVSFPNNIDEATLNSYNAYTIIELEKPSYDAVNEKIIKDPMPQLINGSWTIGWSVVSKSYEGKSMMITRERDRRLNGTFLFDGKEYDFDSQSKARISGAGTLAGFAISSGAQPGDYYWNGGTDPFTWISSDNTKIQMDAQTCFSFAKTAAEFERNLIFKARLLKDMETIPTDYENDSYWI